ncbi:MAG: multiheme c-type cytochrome, partial [Planctomycetota bacterium]
MKYCFLMFVLAAAAVAEIGCEQINVEQQSKTSTEHEVSAEPVTDDEPLLLDDEPLLLDDGPDVDLPAGPVADNSRCYVCHMNYMQEDIAVIHARVNIGCASCHGNCDAHIADESWAWGGNGTPPGIMYRRPEINPFCMGCHPRDKIDTEQHKPLFAGTVEQKHCTDCHG